MARLNFVRPKTLPDAIRILESNPDWMPLAGGTDLLVRSRDGLLRAEGVVDLTALSELRGIRVADAALVIGALVTHSELASDPRVRHLALALAQAAEQIGSPAIRNRGTLGGNLVNASPAADLVPPLVALDAVVLVEGPTGLEEVPAESFAEGPGRTVLRAAQIVTGVKIRLRGDTRRSRFVRLGTRNALAIAKVSVAIAAQVDERQGILRDVRIALGAVGPTVLRASRAEKALDGWRFREGPFPETALEAVRVDARPITDLRSTDEYRREMCAVLLRRAALHIVAESSGAER